mmetsp:Transcript_25433/g.59510  ORF Transcript_25433/g.59510 Transcript_25433/m.59510 type:complete len:223 (-) Transcript_25433:175-843(-)
MCINFFLVDRSSLHYSVGLGLNLGGSLLLFLTRGCVTICPFHLELIRCAANGLYRTNPSVGIFNIERHRLPVGVSRNLNGRQFKGGRTFSSVGHGGRFAFLDESSNNGVRDSVFHISLGRSPDWAGTELGRVGAPFLQYLVNKAIAHRQGDGPFLRSPIYGLVHNELDDIAKVSSAKGRKDNNLIDAIQQFRLHGRFELFLDYIGHLGVLSCRPNSLIVAVR